MASFAPVKHHHPPFVYDPSCKPTKSILKQKSRLSRTPSSWLSNINSKLASNFTDTNPTEPQSPAQQPSSRQNQQQQESARPLGLFRKLINNNNNTQFNDNSSITSVGSAEGQAIVLDSDELTPEKLKRVRFSVGQLTTEYYPYRKSVDADEKEEEPTTASSNDAPELPEDATKTLLLSPDEPTALATPNTTLETATADKTTTKKTSGELLELYELACRNKEEMPLFGFVTSIKGAIDVASLTTIDFSGQPLTRRMVEPMADVLGYVHQLHELNLSNCGLEDDAIKVLLHALLLNDTLTHLSLANNKNLKTAGFKYIAIYVKGASKLEYLDLSMLAPDKKAIEYLSQAITPSNNVDSNNPPRSATVPSLKHLRLDGCVFNKAPMVAVLASGVRKSGCLRNLSLANCKINNQGAVWLGVMLRDYDNTDSAAGLYQLNLDNNDIREGIQYIAQALRRNRCLATLSLRDCKLDAKGCALVGEALKYNQSLAKLNISANALNHPNIEGVLSIKQALYSNGSLKELNLSDTGLTSEAAIALAECLPENRSLCRLDLSKNPGIELAGLMALAASIRLNNTLTFMDVNIPTNDRDMAKIQSDIVTRCTTNAQAVQQQQQQQQQQLSSPSTPERPQQSIQRQGSQSSLDSRATAPTTARLSLQERLAAVTRGKTGPAVTKPTAVPSTAAAAALPPSPQTPRRPEPKNTTAVRPAKKAEKPVVDAEMIATSVTQVTLLEEMLVAEASQRDEMVDTAHAPGDVVLLVFGRCRKSQAAISSRIPHVTDSDQLVQLLEVNDRLTAAIARYQRLFTTETVDNKNRTESVAPVGAAVSDTQQQQEQAPDVKKESTDDSLSSSLLYINTTEPPLSTSFEIGDVDDDDDFVPLTHPSSPGITTSYQVE